MIRAILTTRDWLPSHMKTLPPIFDAVRTVRHSGFRIRDSIRCSTLDTEVVWVTLVSHAQCDLACKPTCSQHGPSKTVVMNPEKGQIRKTIRNRRPSSRRPWCETPHPRLQRYFKQKTAKALHHKADTNQAGRPTHLALEAKLNGALAACSSATQSARSTIKTVAALRDPALTINAHRKRLISTHSEGAKNCQLKIKPLKKERCLAHDWPFKHGWHSLALHHCPASVKAPSSTKLY